MPPSVILHDVRLPFALCCAALFSRCYAAATLLHCYTAAATLLLRCCYAATLLLRRYAATLLPSSVQRLHLMENSGL